MMAGRIGWRIWHRIDCYYYVDGQTIEKVSQEMVSLQRIGYLIENAFVYCTLHLDHKSLDSGNCGGRDTQDDELACLCELHTGIAI